MLSSLTLRCRLGQLRMLLEVRWRVAAVVLDMYMFAVLRNDKSGLQLHLASRVVVDCLDGSGDEREASVVLHYVAQRRIVPHLAKQGRESTLKL